MVDISIPENGLLRRLADVEARIQAACLRSGRTTDDIHIVAVTKYVSLSATEQAVELGLLHIGENRWQDAKPKWETIGGQALWHFLGHLQTNKVKEVIGKFTYIHSLDRLALALELDKKAGAAGLQLNCFVQVNISGEDTKYGLAPDQAFAFFEQLRPLTHLRILGLMTMAPHEQDPQQTRPVFRQLRELMNELNRQAALDYQLTELSMGMSNDFEVAIEEGATWIRLGSILVGKEGGE